MYIVLGIFLTVFGIFMILNPEMTYELLESWKHDGADGPSRLYILNIRIGGCVFTTVGALCTLILIFAR